MMGEKIKRGILLEEINWLREVEKRYCELLKWHIEHAQEVMEIENKGLRR